VANEVDHQFWREFCSSVRKIKSDFFILGELWHNSIKWLGSDQFDSTMNYPLTNACDELFIKTGKPSQFVNSITNLLHWYPSTTNSVLFNMLSSHDIERLLTRCKDDVNKAKLSYAFILTYPGSPCIYYGDEIGMKGGVDPDCRQCMEWDTSLQNKEIFEFIKKLIRIRKEHQVFFNGDFHFVEVNDNQNYMIFKRSYLSETVMVLINLNANKNITLNLKLKEEEAKDLLTNEKVKTSSVRMEASSCRIILRRKDDLISMPETLQRGGF